MDELERFINGERDGSSMPLIDLALVHYQLEAIHPFADGNGRVGRMLISLMAVHNGLLEMPVLYISPVMERYKNEYIDLMFNVSAKGDWHAWLNFFFERVAESCRETVSTIDRLIALQDTYREQATKLGRTSNAITLVDFLFERPAITVNEAKDKLGVSYPAAKNTIDKLVELEILRPFEGTYPKVYYAPMIMRVSEPREPAPSADELSNAGPDEPELPFAKE